MLTGPNVNAGYVRQIINLTQTTSASYLLLSSLDISRRNLALRGKESFGKVMELAGYARKEINQIGVTMLSQGKRKTEAVFLILIQQNFRYIRWILGWQELRSMIFCGMSMIFR